MTVSSSTGVIACRDDAVRTDLRGVVVGVAEGEVCDVRT